PERPSDGEDVAANGEEEADEERHRAENASEAEAPPPLRAPGEKERRPGRHQHAEDEVQEDVPHVEDRGRGKRGDVGRIGEQEQETGSYQGRELAVFHRLTSPDALSGKSSQVDKDSATWRGRAAARPT